MTQRPQRTAGGIGAYVFVGVVVVLVLAGSGYLFGIFDLVRSPGTTPTVQSDDPLSQPANRPAAGARPPIAAGSADASDAELVALGSRVYDDACASCHGAALEGQPNWRERLPNGLLPAPPHDDSGHTWHHSDPTLFGITKYGIAEFNDISYDSAMPVYRDVLSDREIWAVLAFIKSHWSARSRGFQERVTAQEAKQ